MGKGANVIEERHEWAVTANRYKVSLQGDENVLELDYGDDYATL